MLARDPCQAFVAPRAALFSHARLRARWLLAALLFLPLEGVTVSAAAADPPSGRATGQATGTAGVEAPAAINPATHAPSSDLQPWTRPHLSALRLSDIGGQAHDLAAYANTHTGNIVIVHFFATWCAPCRGELTSLERFSSASARKVTVLAVNVAEVPARVRAFLAETPVSFPVLMDVDRTATKEWAVTTLPTSFVLSRGRSTRTLAPRFMAEGDVDWTSARVRRALEEIAAKQPR